MVEEFDEECGVVVVWSGVGRGGEEWWGGCGGGEV